MDKTWVKDVKEGEKVKSVFLVARKATPTAKSGKTYLAATFTDKTGELEARAFDRLEELGAFEEKDYVEVEGQVGTFQGKPQLRLETVAKVDPAALDAAEFVWVAPPEPKKPEKPAAEPEEGPWQELLVLVEAVTDQHVKGLIAAFLGDDDFAARLRRAAAAKTVHHAYPGGLLEHTLSSIKLAHRLADHYPQVDRDLLVAGAFFHDIGKVRELTTERQAEYTDEGKLVGHLVMSAQWIHDKARRVGMPRELEHHIVHIVLSHHGKLEYGSPKVPLTLEALLTHYLDEIDSRVNSWLNLMGKDGGGNRRWTDTNNVYEQPIWRGALPTVQAEKKGPPAEAMTPVIYVPRDGGGQGPKKRLDRPERPEKKPRPAQPRPERKAEDRPAEAPAVAEGAPAEGAPPTPRPPRPEGRPDRGVDRGGHRGPGSFGGPGDKKKGYTGPRLPGDKGPHRPPGGDKPKSLTHNPFAALAAKLGEGADKPAEPQAEAAPEPAVEAAPPAPPPEAPAAETPAAEAPATPATSPEGASS
jgi:3'-5' exoribonuclease